MSEFTDYWDAVCDSDGERTERMRVSGGWIYKTKVWTSPDYDHQSVSISVSLVFIPDNFNTIGVGKL